MAKKQFFIVVNVVYDEKQVSEDQLLDHLPNYVSIALGNSELDPYRIENPIVYKSFEDLQADVKEGIIGGN